MSEWRPLTDAPPMSLSQAVQLAIGQLHAGAELYEAIIPERYTEEMNKQSETLYQAADRLAVVPELYEALAAMVCPICLNRVG